VGITVRKMEKKKTEALAKMRKSEAPRLR